jgi:hypothetical protein
MGTNSYNNESRHSKLIEDLKSLPKIQAPENFEYNLMTRIQNQNFGDVKRERMPFNLTKFLAPSAIVVTALILFFIFFSPSKRQNENPFMTEPLAIASDSQTALSDKDLSLNNRTTSAESQTGIAETNISKQNKNNLDAKIQPNDVVVKKQNRYPINSNRSISLDDFISGDSQQKSSLEGGNVVSGGENSPEFDGFLVRQAPDKATAAKYRAYIDSVKKARLIADSIKNASK